MGRAKTKNLGLARNNTQDTKVNATRQAKMANAGSTQARTQQRDRAALTIFLLEARIHSRRLVEQTLVELAVLAANAKEQRAQSARLSDARKGWSAHAVHMGRLREKKKNDRQAAPASTTSRRQKLGSDTRTQNKIGSERDSRLLHALAERDLFTDVALLQG
jgi:hypothetical protein